MARDIRVAIIGDASQFNREMGRVESTTSNFGRNLMALGAVAGAGFAALGVNIAKTGIEYNTLEQTSRAAFKTILGSTEAANKMMDDLMAFAKQSPFPRQAFIEATRQMLGFGFAAKDVIPTLGIIEDAVAAMGGGAEEISTIVDVFSKIQSQGKVMSDDLNRLSAVGINGFEMLADAAGVSVDDIRKAIETGSVDAETAIAGLTAGMEENFAGAAEGVKSTWTGATDSLSAAWRDFSSLLVSPFIDPRGGGLAIEWANNLADGIRTGQEELKKLGDAFSTGGWAGFQDQLSESADMLGEWWSNELAPKIEEGWNTALDVSVAWWDEHGVELLDAVGAWWESEDVSGFLGQRIGEAMGAAIAVAAVTAAEAIPAAMGRLFGADGWQAAINTWIPTFGGMMTDGLLRAFSQMIVDVWDGAFELGRGIITGVISGIGDAFGWLGKVLIGVFHGVIDIPRQILGIASPSKVFAVMGAQVILGFIEGLVSMLPSLDDIVSKIAGGVISKFNQVFIFGSPSKTMRDLGLNVMAGFDVGLRQGAAGVAATVQGITAELINALSGGWGVGEGTNFNWIGLGDPRLQGKSVFEDGTIKGMPGWRVPRWEMPGSQGVASAKSEVVQVFLDGELVSRPLNRQSNKISRATYGRRDR